MSLFPAYATGADVLLEVLAVPECSNMTPAQEAQLLESEDDAERLPIAPAEGPAREPDKDYYQDCMADRGNLKVSTLYFPGRPEYTTQRGAVGTRVFMPDSRKRRYYQVICGTQNAILSDEYAKELTARTKAYKLMIAQQPTNEALWLKFIDFQERCRSVPAATVTADKALARLPGSDRVRALLYRLRASLAMPHHRLMMLRDDLAACERRERNTKLVMELWLRVLDVMSQCHGGSDLNENSAKALKATHAFPSVYPHILYTYGAYLRSAGLWERLVLLLELVTSMNFPPSVFPPPEDLARFERMEVKLQEMEDALVTSGLPLSTVWVRVERARSAAHWRAAPPGAPEGLDPQRAPRAADVAELLLPARAADSLLLLVQVLRLAKVPLMPLAGHVAAALNPGNEAAGDVHWAAGGEALMSLARAARRLPAAHPARAHGASGARRTVAYFVDPPHYYTDDTGYLSWVSALWEASCSWSGGAARVAVLCWRLRWMHALLLLLDTQVEENASEARRIRSEARAALKQWAGSSPLPFAQFARLELAAGRGEAARRAALQALRSALREPRAPPEHCLYVARVVSEVCEGPLRNCTGEWATLCAVLQAALPDDEQLARPPPHHLLDAALRRCETECTEIEASLDEESPPVEPAVQLEQALLPARAEWGSARARLAPAPRRAVLLRTLQHAVDLLLSDAASRYWEQCACALAQAASREHRAVVSARALAPMFPHNAYLALACSGTATWWRGARQPEPGGARPRTTHVGALAQLYPSLLRAVTSDWQTEEATRVAVESARATRGGGGGALVLTAHLEAEARGARGRVQDALLTALDERPLCKWTYVRGAAWCGAQAASLTDALMERGIRQHALLAELELPYAVPAHPAHPPSA